MDRTFSTLLIVLGGIALLAFVVLLVRATRSLRATLRTLQARTAAHDLQLAALQRDVDAAAPTPRAKQVYERMAPLMSKDPAKRRKADKTPRNAGDGLDGASSGMRRLLTPIPLDAPILETERDLQLTRALQLPDVDAGSDDATQVMARPGPGAFETEGPASPTMVSPLAPRDPKPRE